MGFLTMKKKIEVLEHAFAASAGAYYNINLTKDLVPGTMYQVIDDKEYSLNEKMGLPENAQFTDVVAWWGEKLPEEEKTAYFEFLNIPNLLESFRKGEIHVVHQYWTKSVVFEPMLAQQHIVMYEDEETGDILAITYILDLTQKFMERQYKKELERKQIILAKALHEAEKAREYREMQTALDAVDNMLGHITALDSVVNEEELDSRMPDLLASMGSYSMSDRAYIFTWVPGKEKEQVMRMTHEWCADGVTPTIDMMQDLRMEDMPNWTPRLNRGEAIVSRDWEAEKEKTPEKYAVFDGQDIQSLIVIPIFASKKLNGYIGFDNPDQRMADLSVRLLSSIGTYIGGIKENLSMMSELEQKQISLQKSWNEARRANIAKTDFLRRMSHDIRTPINGIQGMIAIAEHYPDDSEKQKECLGKIKEASGFLLDLVNSILDMNKLESGTVVLDHKPFDLLQVLQEIHSIAEMNSAQNGLRIVEDYSQVQHTHLVGSPLHLKQILQNIAVNAVKYNRIGGSIQLMTEEIACDDERAVYRFTCADTGLGMSEDFIPHAFEPFAQENSDARTSYMGTGLGLAITKQLVEMMDGSIDVESRQNAGTTFRIVLSFELDHHFEQKKKIEQSLSDEVLYGKRVLLAEDNALNMEIARFILENAGMDVTTAENGKEAVEIFEASEENYFDLILMDIMMPEMDGLSAVRTIRSMKRSDAEKVPVFAMTANAFSEDIEQSREAGMNEHLAKPLNKNEILNKIKHYMVLRLL